MLKTIFRDFIIWIGGLQLVNWSAGMLLGKPIITTTTYLIILALILSLAENLMDWKKLTK